MFHRAGQEQPITKVLSWRGELDPSMLGRKVYGPYREDGYYLIPTGMLVREGQLLIDYAANAAGVVAMQLPAAPAVQATKNFGNLDPAPGAKPNLQVLQAFIKRLFPGFPVPNALP